MRIEPFEGNHKYDAIPTGNCDEYSNYEFLPIGIF